MADLQLLPCLNTAWIHRESLRLRNIIMAAAGIAIVVVIIIITTTAAADPTAVSPPCLLRNKPQR